jgi:hypothetical protein
LSYRHSLLFCCAFHLPSHFCQAVIDDFPEKDNLCLFRLMFATLRPSFWKHFI